MFAIKNSNKTTRSTNKFIGVSQGMRQIKNQFRRNRRAGHPQYSDESIGVSQ